MKSMSLQEPSSTQSDLQNPPSIVISSDLELRDRDGSALDDDDEIKDEKFFLNDENPGGSFSPPDGGFGWIVVFASFMCNVIVDGIIFSFGILLPKISSEFDESKATTAWIGSLQTGFYLIVGEK